MYGVGERIVHPLHGAGVIREIVTQKVNGTVKEYYLLTLPLTDMDVMVPVDAGDRVGLRPVMEREKALSFSGTVWLNSARSMSERVADSILVHAFFLRLFFRFVVGEFVADDFADFLFGEAVFLFGIFVLVLDGIRDIGDEVQHRSGSE